MVVLAKVRRPLLLPLLVALHLGGTAAAHSQDYRLILDLRGIWKFELGDDPKWADPAFDDNEWAAVKVPSPWEDQGFPGYDGYGWYRISFTIPSEWAGKRLYVDLGYIDDVDATYLNGHWIGFRGSFPPVSMTAYNESRRYAIPPEALVFGGTNVLAVRVYDSELGGGISRGGGIGIWEMVSPLELVQSLEGTWKFQQGDNLEWRKPEFNDKNWQPIGVPGFWETQGNEAHDGFGWYRLRFRAKPGLSSERLVLFLGRIDDYDEVFLNGERIGRTGKFPEDEEPTGNFNDYQAWRAYTIPSVKLIEGGENVVAVRTFDRFMHGGIYEGPIGIALRESYLKWRPRTGKGVESGLQKLIDWLFR